MTAAYTLVDLSDVDPDVRKKLLDDANAGGSTYGLRVVEEVINGGARAPIYGYYRDGPDHERWDKAKVDLGLGASDVADDEVMPAQPDLAGDARREAAIRDQAAASATELADRIRQGDDAAVEAITGIAETTGDTGADNTHSVNVVDTTLSPGATNEASKAGSTQETEKLAKKPAPNKAPK